MRDIICELFDIVENRKIEREEGSYTSYLFDKGIEKILKKIGEESTEVVIGAMKGDKQETVNEICDLLYHLLVLSSHLNISMEMIEGELVQRRAKMNNFKGERKEIEKF